MRTLIAAIALAAFVGGPASAKMVEDKIDYQMDGKKFQGVLVYDDSVSGKRPAVLMSPNWLGVTGAAVTKAKLLAGSKYVYFVADMYGIEGKPKSYKDAGKAAGMVRNAPAVSRARINKAMDVMLAEGGKRGIIDAGKTAAIGFCFGGGTVLDLARSGRAVGGVVTFHGDLATKEPGGQNVKAKILVLHGANDPVVPKADRDAFEAEMTPAKVDYQMVVFSNTVHSFTDPNAKVKGRAEYNAETTKRAYTMLEDFFKEIF